MESVNALICTTCQENGDGLSFIISEVRRRGSKQIEEEEDGQAGVVGDHHVQRVEVPVVPGVDEGTEDEKASYAVQRDLAH